MRRSARRSLAAPTARSAPPITPPSGKTSHQKFAAKCSTGVTSPGCHRESRSGAGAITPKVSTRRCGSVPLGLEPLDRALDLRLGVFAADPVRGLDELARFQVLVVHEEVLDHV